ncbi:MAG: E3 binding domain-containing protein, partial [Cyclobacteriaceae bacterium]|nr:E3 binding domain-containing protein [Cyclobacteriaceae bacterium]
MAEIVRMPKMSDTMEEGVIASWLVKVGDNVKSGDVLAEVETDKATMELESYEEGTILHLGVKEKDAVKIDGVIAIIGEKGENIDGLLNSSETSDDKPKEDTQVVAKESTPKEAIDTSNINATVITMPKMSDTMTEGIIANWLKKVGDDVKSGDILAEVETDKATMELEAYEDGKLLYIGIEAGSAAPIDGIIAVIGEDGADYKTLIKAHNTDSLAEPVAKSDKTLKAAPPTAPKVGDKVVSASATVDGRIKVSPLAKRLAKDLGYEVNKIPGTGEGGRVIKRDVESYTPMESAPASVASSEQAGAPIQLPTIVGEESSEDIALSQMRKTIARRLSESKFTSPHFYLTMEINMDKAIDARNSMNEMSPVKISF